MAALSLLAPLSIRILHIASLLVLVSFRMQAHNVTSEQADMITDRLKALDYSFKYDASLPNIVNSSGSSGYLGLLALHTN